MSGVVYTLLADGASDRALLAPITWNLRRILPDHAIQPEWADLWRLRERPRGLTERVIAAVRLYPCDILFVHRDAERSPPIERIAEIRNALDSAADRTMPTVCVVPVRMTEAWFIFNEAALRTAAGNPRGRENLNLPPLASLESLPDPKVLLHNLLRAASGLSGRRLKRFQPTECVKRLSELIDDFSPIETLPAFREMQVEIRAAIAELNQGRGVREGS